MTLASLNFTERQKIRQEDIEIDIESSETGYKVSGKVDLSRFTFPPARLVVEVYRQEYRQRISVMSQGGVVEFAQTFPKYSQTAALRADVKLVSLTADKTLPSQILASARQVQPNLIGDHGGFRKGLLAFLPKEDLGQLLWVTDFSDDYPVVHVNSKIRGGWNTFCRQPIFQSLVMPEITRDIADWLWDKFQGGASFDSSEFPELWRLVFLEFGADLNKSIADAEDARQWAVTAVSAFTTKFRFLDNLPAVDSE